MLHLKLGVLLVGLCWLVGDSADAAVRKTATKSTFLKYETLIYGIKQICSVYHMVVIRFIPPLPGYFACYVLELNTIVLLVTKLLK